VVGGTSGGGDLTGNSGYRNVDSCASASCFVEGLTVRVTFIYGLDDMTVEQINSAEKALYLHHDQAGSTRLITGSSGTVEGKCSYSAYGIPTSEGTATTPLGYDGQYTSSDTSLIYMRARAYDPATAQFLSVDPLEATTEAPYYYAGDNPLDEADPTGLGNWLGLGIPSPGEVAEKLNPVKYYEEEIESYEKGCHGWDGRRQRHRRAGRGIHVKE
jgi:RHS repeat-associated protein